jgi:hypothetical protein
MIRRRPCSRIQGRTARAKRERGTRSRAVADGLTHQTRGVGPFAEFGCVQRFVEAVGREDILAVAVPVDE